MTKNKKNQSEYELPFYEKALNAFMGTILSVSTSDINVLIERAKGIERAQLVTTSAYGRKMCPTRHGCQGATDCNYSYGSYPG